MSSRLLILDLKRDLLAAILLTVDGKDMQITHQATLRPGSRPILEDLTELLQGLDVENATCHLNLDARDFLFRNLTVPFADSKTIHKILPLEMQDNIPVRLDRLLIDALISRVDDQKSQVIAAMIDRELLGKKLQTLQELDISPESISISGIATALRLLHNPEAPSEFLLLNINFHGALLILAREGRIELIRPLIFDVGPQAGFQLNTGNQDINALNPEDVDLSIPSLCATIRQTLQALFYTGEATIFLSGSITTKDDVCARIQAGLGSLCRHCTTIFPENDREILPAPDQDLPLPILRDAINTGWQVTQRWKGFNFRKDAFALKKTFVFNRRIALFLLLPLGLSALVALGLLWRNHSRLLTEEKELTKQLTAIFTETLPEVTRIVDPIQQLQVKIKETSQDASGQGNSLPSASILRILTALSAGIPESLDVHLARFMVDDTGIRIKGSTDTFNTVDAIKKGLEQSSAFSSVEISSANLDPKNSRIRFEMKLTIKGA